MDDAGAVLGGHVVRDQDAVRVLATREVVEGRHVGETREVRALDETHPREARVEVGLRDLLIGDRDCLTNLSLVSGEPRRRNDELPARKRAVLARQHNGVLDVRADGRGKVGRERPRRRRPDEHRSVGQVAGGVDERQQNSERGVLTVLIHVVVHAQLVVGQRCLVAPAIRKDAVALIREALVVKGLEGPNHGLHVRHIEGLVVVLEVDPARLARDVLLPILRVLEDRVLARLVEGGDAHLLDLGLVGDAQDALGLELSRQPMRVPAKPALDLLAAHRLKTRDDVLGVAGEQVAVVRQPVRERRPVVEDKLLRVVAIVDRRLEGAVRLPVRQHVLLDGGESGRWRHLGGGIGRGAVQGVAGVAHGGSLGQAAAVSRLRWSLILARTPRPEEPCPSMNVARYHLACLYVPLRDVQSHSCHLLQAGAAVTGCPCGSTESPEGSRSSASSPVIAGSTLLRQVYANARPRRGRRPLRVIGHRSSAGIIRSASRRVKRKRGTTMPHASSTSSRASSTSIASSFTSTQL